MTVPARSVQASARLAARTLLRPSLLVVAAATVILPILWHRLATIGIATHDADPTWLSYEVAFMAGLLGCLLGMSWASVWRWCTSRWLPHEVLIHEAVFLALPAVGLAAVPLVASFVSRLEPPTWRGLVPLSFVLARLVATGLVLLRLPLQSLPRALIFLAVCWWIPAALAPSFHLGPGLPTPLCAWDGGGQALATPKPWVAEISALLALLMAARLGLAGSRQLR